MPPITRRGAPAKNSGFSEDTSEDSENRKPQVSATKRSQRNLKDRNDPGYRVDDPSESNAQSRMRGKQRIALKEKDTNKRSGLIDQTEHLTKATEIKAPTNLPKRHVVKDDPVEIHHPPQRTQLGVRKDVVVQYKPVAVIEVNSRRPRDVENEETREKPVKRSRLVKHTIEPKAVTVESVDKNSPGNGLTQEAPLHSIEKVNSPAQLQQNVDSNTENQGNNHIQSNPNCEHSFHTVSGHHGNQANIPEPHRKHIECLNIKTNASCPIQKIEKVVPVEVERVALVSPSAQPLAIVAPHSIAAIAGATKHSPAKRTPNQQPTDTIEPFHKTPIYSKQTTKTDHVPKLKPPSDQNVDDEFALMPLKPRSKRIKKVSLSKLAEDVYGFDVSDSVAPKPKAAVRRAAKKATTTKKPHKKIEPPKGLTGLKLWDEKDLNARQKQIKLNIVNKDFKPHPKPIPAPPPLQRIPTTVAAVEFHSQRKTSTPEKSAIFNESTSEAIIPFSKTHSPNFSAVVPWRYSSVHALPPRTPYRSLNSSNDAENQSRGSNVSGLAQPPMHELKPARSPMKELKRNETIPVRRQEFGIDEAFGFDQSDDELDENSDEKARFISTKLNHLKEFRHSLNKSLSIDRPAEVLKPAAATKPATRIQNLFTSTPQQKKINECFKASTPLAQLRRPPRPAEDDMAVVPSTPGTVDEDEAPNLFESLKFVEPPKRNYSLVGIRRKQKKVNMYGLSEDEESEDEESEVLESPGNSAKVPPKKTKAVQQHEVS